MARKIGTIGEPMEPPEGKQDFMARIRSKRSKKGRRVRRGFHMRRG